MSRVFGFLKPKIDIHTLGIAYASDLLEVCGYKTIICDSLISMSIETLDNDDSVDNFVRWIIDNRINELCFSYRLDPYDGLFAFERVYLLLKKMNFFESHIQRVYFAGLPLTCSLVKSRFSEVEVFEGDETILDTLNKFNIPKALIPNSILSNSEYDDARLDFANTILESSKYLKVFPTKKVLYPDFGTEKDNIIKRLFAHQKENVLPLIRVHAGPYNTNSAEAVREFKDWLKIFVDTRFVDIVSIGTSQLTQSNFGEDWTGRSNGGGVPIRTEEDFRSLWNCSRPLLLRAYSGTKDIVSYASMLDQTINNAWHALSIWWFNKMDGRGDLSVADCIDQHVKTIQFIGSKEEVFEPNVSHHFAFRGADDLTYIISGYIAARTAKFNGIKYLVLQNMLNTPKLTDGIRDIAKARVLLKLVKGLEDANFRVIYQPRAGLSYFSPSIDKAKRQLVAVSALMTDILYEEQKNPDIIHVVSYSEASHLATPQIINESVQLTFAALTDYPRYRKKMSIEDILRSQTLNIMESELMEDALNIIQDIERQVVSPYTASGLYSMFKKGYFAVPSLWECRSEFSNAVNWRTRVVNGGVAIIHENGTAMSVNERIRIINENKL